jgi:hypothetical protein
MYQKISTKLSRPSSRSFKHFTKGRWLHTSGRLTEYDDVPEHKHLALKAFFKEFQADYKRKMASYFRKTRQCVVEKEKFVMPTLPSKVCNDVRFLSPDLVGQFLSIVDQKFADSIKFTNDLLLNLADQVQILSKDNSVDI